MTDFSRIFKRPGKKRQTKLNLSPGAYGKLVTVSAKTGVSMSSIVDMLIVEHCFLDDEPQAFDHITELDELPADMVDIVDLQLAQQRKRRDFDLE